MCWYLFPAWSNAADEEGHAAVDEWLRIEEERTIKECNDCAEMRAARDRSGDVTTVEERRKRKEEESGLQQGESCEGESKGQLGGED